MDVVTAVNYKVGRYEERDGGLLQTADSEYMKSNSRW